VLLGHPYNNIHIIENPRGGEMETIKLYILDFCYCDTEPAHILFGALLKEKLVNSVEDVVNPIFELIEEGLLKVYLEDDKSEHDIPVNITKQDLLAHIKRSEMDKGVFEYPLKFEYIFKTTEKGSEALDDISIDELMAKNK
jgi:hypothetical protein